MIEIVCRHTRREAADVYFGGHSPMFAGFEVPFLPSGPLVGAPPCADTARSLPQERMIGYLCGKLVTVYSASGQKTTAVKNSCTPAAVAVARELEILERIVRMGLFDGRAVRHPASV